MCTNDIFNACHQAWGSHGGPNPNGLPWNQENCEQLCPNWAFFQSQPNPEACIEGVREWCACSGRKGQGQRGTLPSWCQNSCTSDAKRDVVGACRDLLSTQGREWTLPNAIAYCGGELDHNPRYPQASQCNYMDQGKVIACSDFEETNSEGVPSYCLWKCASAGGSHRPCRVCNDSSPNISEQCKGHGVQGYPACVQSCGHVNIRENWDWDQFFSGPGAFAEEVARDVKWCWDNWDTWYGCHQ